MFEQDERLLEGAVSTIDQHLGLAKTIAGNMSKGALKLEYEDLQQEAVIAIWQQYLRYEGKEIPGAVAGTVIKRRLHNLVQGKGRQVGSRVYGTSLDALLVSESYSKDGDDDGSWIGEVPSGLSIERDVTFTPGLAAFIEQFMATQQDRFARAFQRVVLDGLSLTAVAKEEGASRQTVAYRVKRATEDLRAWVAADPDRLYLLQA